MEAVYFFTFQKKTAFIPLRYVYPECALLIKHHTSVEPLQCFDTECPANENCAEILCRRINYLFTNVMPDVELLFLYFDYRNDGFKRRGKYIPSLGAGVFDRDLENPRWMKLNRWGFNKCQKEGVTYQWVPDHEFLLMGSSGDFVPVGNLIDVKV